MGCRALLDHVRNRFQVTPGETASDQSLTVEAVYCLGNCACAPAVMLDGKLYGRVSTEILDRLIDRARSET
jgi:formate dehydrogenase subunit gamma